MKSHQKSVNIFFVFLLILGFVGLNCSSSLENSITFQNLASNRIFINFRGELITVEAGETKIVKEIPKGLFTYSTTYEIPAGAQGSSTIGDVSGEMDIFAGTKILIVYSSTYLVGTYTLYATFSSSDDQSQITPTTP
ncbi:MAG: hypothetical protein IPH11_07970 [Ignavibacteriales bacterium]|nr:hypothetical protein [Ignavibacteriales bacterium]